MSAAANPDIVEDDLVLCLDAGDSKSYSGSGDNWYDRTELGGYAVAANSPTFSNKSWAFGGTDDYFRLTRSDLNGGSFAYDELTCMMWIKPSSTGNGGATSNNIITVENSFEISVGKTDTTYSQIAYASNPWAWRYSNTQALINDQWQMLTFRHSSANRWLHVNNEQIYVNNSDTGIIYSGTSSYPYLTIAARRSGTSSQYEGGIATILLYSRSLTTDEITQNYNATKSRFGL